MDWEATRHGRNADVCKVFELSTDLLQKWGMTFCPMNELLVGSMSELVGRIEKIANLDLTSAVIPAALGAIDLPDISLHDMADRMPILKEADIRAKNHVQRREWCGNFIRAASDFTSQIGARPILTISDQDAANYEKFWKDRVKSSDVTANYANKQLRYVIQMINAHLDDIRVPRPKRVNPPLGASVEKHTYSESDMKRRKLPLPDKWIRDRLIVERVLEGLSQQASDVAIIEAITGRQASEIYNVPPEDIHLDHEIPHFSIRVVLNGEFCREIKNRWSTRDTVVLGPALDALRRNPEGFPEFRGNAKFSSYVNKYLREQRLFPKQNEGVGERYVISGMRHSFEDRMKAAKIGNEERAFFMGHSIGKVRGRPVYGGGLDLPLRAILQEMVGFLSAD